MPLIVILSLPFLALEQFLLKSFSKFLQLENLIVSSQCLPQGSSILNVKAEFQVISIDSLKGNSFSARTLTIIIRVFSTLQEFSLVYLLKACIGLKVVLKDPIKNFYLSVSLQVEYSAYTSFNKGVGIYFSLEFRGDLSVLIRDYSLRRAKLEFNTLIE